MLPHFSAIIVIFWCPKSAAADRAPCATTRQFHSASDPAGPVRPVHRFSHPMTGLVIDGDRQLKGSYQHEKEAKNEVRKSAHKVLQDRREVPCVTSVLVEFAALLTMPPSLTQPSSVVRVLRHYQKEMWASSLPLAPLHPPITRRASSSDEHEER